MLIAITTLEGQTFETQVGEDLDLLNFKALCEVETNIPACEMSIVWNGRPLQDDKRTLKQYGIGNGDIVLIKHAKSRQTQQQGPSQGASTSSGTPRFDFSSIRIPGQSQPTPQSMNEGDPDVVRNMFLSDQRQLALLKERNPPLAEALLSGDTDRFAKVFEEQKSQLMREGEERRRLLSADPFDPLAQEKIEETIRQKNIETNMETAMEFAPESFGQVHMLYVDCKVNGHPVKAFVDSGAQMTIMSQRCAERCHIMRLVDKRWAGVAKGVGTQKILGRVHLCQIQIGPVFLQSSFSILEDQPMDMLLGLDMLRRHQCVLDLKKNQLEIGTTNTITPFLSEGDLPEHARLNAPNQMSSQTEDDRGLDMALSQSTQEASDSSSSKPSSSSSHGQIFPDEVISHLMTNGFSRESVVEELRKANGNADEALASLFAKHSHLP